MEKYQTSLSIWNLGGPNSELEEELSSIYKDS